jgi:hypothetical protein
MQYEMEHETKKVFKDLVVVTRHSSSANKHMDHQRKTMYKDLVVVTRHSSSTYKHMNSVAVRHGSPEKEGVRGLGGGDQTQLQY